MRIYLVAVFIFSLLHGNSQNSIYDYKITTVSGAVVDFNSLKGKIILIVNTASGSERNPQMLQLDSLCKLYAEKGVVVVAFPSNDFMHESHSNEQIKNETILFQPNFYIANKSNVSGNYINPVFKWLSQKQFNGAIDAVIKNDFQKILINREGKIVAVYSGRVSPFDISLINVITTN